MVSTVTLSKYAFLKLKVAHAHSQGYKVCLTGCPPGISRATAHGAEPSLWLGVGGGGGWVFLSFVPVNHLIQKAISTVKTCL